MLAVSCGSAPKKEAAFVPLELADEGDHEAAVKMYEARLAKLEPEHEDYPALLERTALAQLELVDEWTEAFGEAPTPEQSALLGEHRRAAVAHFETLIAHFPTYDGVDAALLMLAYEYESLAELDKRAEVLERLQRDFPQSQYANDALMLLATDAYRAKRNQEALRLIATLRERESNTLRSDYACYMQAWLELRMERFDTALELLSSVIVNTSAELEPGKDVQQQELRDQALGELALFYALSSHPPVEVEEWLRPLASDTDEYLQLLESLEQAYLYLDQSTRAEELRALRDAMKVE
jgi:hypothetical protein